MTPPMPAPMPGQVKVGLGRSNIVVALAVLGFLCWIVWAGVHGAWTSDDTSARVLGYGIAALFAIPLVMLLRFLPRFVSPRYVVFDPFGLRILHGRKQVVMPWQELVAIGIGYEHAPPPNQEKLPTSVDDMKGMAKDYLAGKANEVLQVSDKRRLALEIYPVRPEAVGWFPKLKPYWKQEAPPWAGLPPYHWRFPLPPVVSIGQEIDRGARTFQPQRWLGWIPRIWSERAK